MGEELSEHLKIMRRELRELVEPILAGRGMSLVELIYAPQRGGRALLRLFIDKPGGVDVEDCADVSRDVSDLLDVNEHLIPGPYLLEVSSPGLDRPLRTRDDFVNHLGQKVHVRLYNAIDGRRNFRGILAEVNEGTLLVEADGQRHRLPLDDLDRANLIYGFHRGRP